VTTPTANAHPLILVVDFEATCCDQGTIPSEEMEIIEIGACWATLDGTVLEQFECRVRPTLHPKLTHFCCNLLGIEQSHVASAETITTVSGKLDRFVQLRAADASAWGSWGAFDRNLLERECLRMGLANPIPLTHLNLKQAYAKTKRIGKQVGMRKALELEGMRLEGQHHRALDDALNIARILPIALGGH
jgi:inhibitor of KinA sporulation pathway (predicted exonuclease)